MEPPPLPFSRALVTGAGIRLGRAIALGLARSGCDVAVHYGSSEEPAHKVVEEIAALGRSAVALAADLADIEATRALVGRAAAALGPLDLLINSAAIFEGGTLRDTNVETFDNHLAINLRAPYLLTQNFAAQLDPAAEGAIINIGDARTNRPGADHFAYRLSKAALEVMTQNLAIELAPRIRVAMVSPGAALPAPGQSAAELDHLAQTRIPLRRAGSAGVVVDAVLSLLHNSFLTGVVLPVDGGEWL